MAVSQRSPSLSDMLFPDAADLWLRSCAGISENTRYSRACNIKRLSKCFGEMKLAEIELSHIRDYQAQRAAGTIPGLRKAEPSAINRELSTLKFHNALARRSLTKRKPSSQLPIKTQSWPENSQLASSPMFQVPSQSTVFSYTTCLKKYRRFGMTWPSK